MRMPDEWFETFDKLKLLMGKYAFSDEEKDFLVNLYEAYLCGFYKGLDLEGLEEMCRRAQELKKNKHSEDNPGSDDPPMESEENQGPDQKDVE